MKLNATYNLLGWDATPTFVVDCTLAQALALDGETLTVSEDGGTQIAVFDGYSVTGVWRDDAGEATVIQARRALSDATAQAIEGLDANVLALSGRATALEQGAQALAESIQTTDAKAVAAQSAADAAQASANPQLATLAAIQLPAMAASMTADQAIGVSTLWPGWSEASVAYKADDVVRFDGHLYRCEQAHTSQASWTPDETASLWSRIDIASDGVDVWTQPTGGHNAYDEGDRVHYPNAEGPVYVSLIDGNKWPPAEYPDGWQLEEDGDE